MIFVKLFYNKNCIKFKERSEYNISNIPILASILYDFMYSICKCKKLFRFIQNNFFICISCYIFF